jgi:hypothetical protein
MPAHILTKIAFGAQSVAAVMEWRANSRLLKEADIVPDINPVAIA